MWASRAVAASRPMLAARRSTSASSLPQTTVLAMLVGNDAGSRPIASQAACTLAASAGNASGGVNADVELACVLCREARCARRPEAADDDRRPGSLHGLRQRGGVVDHSSGGPQYEKCSPSGVAQRPVITANCSSR